MRKRLLILAFMYSATCWPAMAAGTAAAVTDLSGLWAREYFGFEPPLSGQGPITNKFRLPNGNSDVSRHVGDYTNPILKPGAAEVVRQRGEIMLSGRTFPEPTNQCAPQSPPYIFWQQEFQLLQHGNEVVILYMHDAQVRHARLNSQHPARVIPSWSGDSVGRYEGDTLVIDTVGVKVGPLSMIDSFGTPQSEAVHVVERYRLIAYDAAIAAEKRGEIETGHFAPDDGTGDGVGVDLDYKGKGVQLELTVEDPNVFNATWSALITYRRAAGEFVERICAENTREFGPERKLPTADKPDF